MREQEVTVTLAGDLLLQPRAVALTPLDVTLDTGDDQQFTATAYGFADPRVTWTATGGVVSSTGRYTAGGAAGTFQVTARSLVDPSVRETARVEIRDQDEEEDDTSPGVGIEFGGRGGSGLAELWAGVVGVYDGVQRYQSLDTGTIDSFDTGPFQDVVARSGAYADLRSVSRGEIDETLQITDRFKGFSHTFDFRVEASATAGGPSKLARAWTGTDGCIDFDVIGKRAFYDLNVSVAANAYVYARLSFSETVDETFEGSGDFASSGELPADSGHGACYSIEAVADTAGFPPLVEGTMTVTLTLRQP